MAFRIALAAGCVLAFTPALAAEPVRIGVTTILSGQYADRGQSEQYGVELALQRINEAGGVLGRPVEAFYGDNAADPATGIAATKRLIEEQHVPVLLGALWTPVTHAIMPIVAEAKVPLVIDISAGQDFVDASGVGGNDYAFKTIPSDRDIALGLMGWLKGKGVHSVAIVSDDNPFNHVNADSMAKAAVGADIKVLANETIAKDTKDLAPLLGQLKALAPDQVVTLLSSFHGAFLSRLRTGWLECSHHRTHRSPRRRRRIVSGVPRLRRPGRRDKHHGLQPFDRNAGGAGLHSGLPGEIRHHADPALILRLRSDQSRCRRDPPRQL